MAAHGSVLTADQPDCPGQRPFQSTPETDTVERRIQHIGDGAIMAVLGVSMMQRVMFGVLQQLDVLQKGDDGAVLFAGAMLPFMELIRIGGQKRKHPGLPAQQAHRPRAKEQEHG